MELTKIGYKQTEVGLIPEDWKVSPLSELGEFKNGINKSKEDFGFGYPFVNLMDVFGIPFIIDNSSLELINANQHELNLYNLIEGDVLFVRSSVKPSGVGLTSVVKSNLNDTVFSGFLIRYRFCTEFNLDYKVYCFNQKDFRDRLIAQASVSANTNINQDALKKLQLAYPPTLTEQKAIATALSDVDSLISSLDKLITKKKAIKQGAMQELLTPPHKGGRRLPGFSGDWTCEPIIGFASITTGTSDTQDRIEDGIYPFFVRSQKVEKINKFSFDGEGILTSGDGVGVGKIFHYINGKFDFHQRVYCIHGFRENVDGKYFFNQFSNHFFDRVMSMTAKSSVDSVRREMIADMKIYLPPTKKEQTTITQILSDMDLEIESLENKKCKYQEIKQGMMQELLTGKTRLFWN
jgi:type I restriction enzyme S subunit